ncbi:MAG: cupin domain-containing protein [Gammaproteobacteria bacterium]|nr:MAG: cupin domain-containing protein [Gammaproteobacteria bacterium]
MKRKRLEGSALPPGALSESKVIKHQGGFAWDGAARRIYKDEPGSWRSVTRTSLVGGSDELPVPFHVRYFEVEAGGFSSLEKHAHQHVVMVVRGGGEVLLGGRRQMLSFGDVVYIAPWEVHQFRNPEGPEPLGFLCVVPAERDRPVAVQEDG